MRILVTGGAGFIGSHLVERLVKLNHEVTVIDNLATGKIKNLSKVINKIKFFKKSICNLKDIKKAFYKQEVVIHLAALADIVPSIENPKEYFDTNVIGSQNIMLCSIKSKIKKVIYAASSSCYGIPKKYPTKEKTILNPQYPYALTKKLGEDLIMHYGKVYNINTISLRLFNVYGLRARSNNNYGAMFGVFLSQIYHNKKITIVGNGNQKRDFLFVDDVVEAIRLSVVKKLANQILNIGYGKPISINKVIRYLKHNKKTYIPKRPGEPHITHADIKLAKKNLNWKPKINIKIGIEVLLKNIEMWKDTPVWSKNNIKKATKQWFKYLKK